MSNHATIVGTLGAEILAGVHAAGENLPPESELLQRFGVSRTALREAIKTLSAKGLLIAKTRVGTRVAEPVNWNYFDPDVLTWRVQAGADAAFRHDLADVRRGLEPMAAALAARRRTEQDLVAMRTCIAAMRDETTSAMRFAQADLDLHLAIGEASKNPMIRSMAGVIKTALLEAFVVSPPVKRPELHQEVVDGHARIVERIAERDEAGAAQAMRDVIDSGLTRLVAEAILPG